MNLNVWGDLMVIHIKNWARKLLFWLLESTSEIGLNIPNGKETELISKLKKKISELDPLPSRSDQNSDWWLQSRQDLRSKILANDPRRFLRWGVVLMNMYPAFNRYLNIEYHYIRQKNDYSSRWKYALLENGIGGGIRYVFNRETSGSAIHSGYHLVRFGEFSGVLLSDIDIVIEFGGGYGRLCEAIYRTGFKGSYVLYDLPEFSALQIFYLRAQGYSVADKMTELKDECVYCTSEINTLEKVSSIKNKKVLFIATWSFSETPLNFRRRFETIIRNSEYLLIGYYEKIYPGSPDEVDNLKYFSALCGEMPSGKIEDVPIVHMGAGSRYLFYMRS